MLKTVDKPTLAPLGPGVYDFTEAARYLKAARYGDGLYPWRLRTLAGWFQRWANERELSESIDSEFPAAVTFSDLISMRLVATLRRAGIRWREIDAIVRRLRAGTETQRPLANQSAWNDVDWAVEVLEELYPLAKGAPHLNEPDFLGLLQDFLIPEHGLAFDEKSGEATSWEIQDGIVLHPLVQSGAPCVKGTRIPAGALAGTVAAGDSIERVAKAYRLAPETVQAACDWEHRLQSR